MLDALACLRNRFRATDPVRMRAAPTGKGAEPLPQIGTQPALVRHFAHIVPSPAAGALAATLLRISLLLQVKSVGGETA